MSRQGFLRVRVDGEILDLKPGMQIDRYKTHDIELVVDRLSVNQDESNQRLKESVKTAMHFGNDSIMLIDCQNNKVRFLSRNLMCPTSGISYSHPEPNSFSFNSRKECVKSVEVWETNLILIIKK